MSRPRVVLDTNCLISALLFSRSELARLRVAWQNELFIPLVCKETAAELIRVLAYPKFDLNQDEINTLLAEVLPFAEAVVLRQQKAKPIEGLRDPDDAVFVRLARQAKADWLVSGDRHLLELEGRFPSVRIITPGDFMARSEIKTSDH